MQKLLLIKIGIIVSLTIIIGLPLIMIQNTIDERKSFHDDAIKSIAADSVSQQTIVGPLLILPYTEEYDELQESAKDHIMVHKTIHQSMVVYPDNLTVVGNIDTDQRYRGIHRVLVYTGQHKISGEFPIPTNNAFVHSKTNSIIKPGMPYVALNIDDVRGIHKIPQINWNGQPFEFQQGSGIAAMPSGLHAPVPATDPANTLPVKFSLDLTLDGIERISFTPVGKNNQFTLTSNWPHPEFSGRFLPATHQRTINSNGFKATWDISSLATNSQRQLSALIENVPAENASATSARSGAVDTFDVNFIEPINIYSQAERAVKYGLLFISVTFAAFFLFEILKKLPIHPIQYALVGLALALFFLLLVSLSEQMSFIQAYITASSACILLNGFYLKYVLQSWKRGLGFGFALTLLYGVLYIVLRSENNALLMGSVLLFGVLTTVMVATRKVDWYQIGKSDSLDKNAGITV